MLTSFVLSSIASAALVRGPQETPEAPAISTDPVVLLPGVFDHADLPVPAAADLGSGWLALVADGDGHRLVETRVSVQPVPLALVEGDSTHAPAAPVEVRGSAAEDALAYLRGVPDLRAGRVTSSPARTGAMALGDWGILGWIGAEAAVLHASMDVAEPALWLSAVEPDPHSPQVVSSLDQRLLTLDEGTSPELLWSGDLDGDLAPDLLLGTESVDGRLGVSLLLSSQAQPTELVHDVAAFSASAL